MNTPIVISNFTIKHNPKRFLAISLVAILVLAGLAWWLFGAFVSPPATRSKAISQGVCSGNNSDNIVSQAANALELGNLKGLESVVTQIKQSPGYTKDANCLYILTAYYQREGNAGQAQIYLNDLNVAYRNHSAVSSYLTGYISVKTLQADTTAMINAYRKEQSNVYYIRPPK